jgi:hypothetical protein
MIFIEKHATKNKPDQLKGCMLVFFAVIIASDFDKLRINKERKTE